MLESKYNILNLDPAWCSWFSGFVDGEGYFQIYVCNEQGKHHGSNVSLTIQLREDDAETILDIHSRLKCGKVYYINNECSRRVGLIASNEARWRVMSIRDITNIIIPLFDQYPLRTTKAFDYKLWRYAAIIISNRHHLAQPGMDDLRSLRDTLKEKRKGPHIKSLKG